ncbi:YhjD/YihY/BrkB family envelope integrity protein, partial [Arthrospira platensis SPKY1]|nr:YhjD/YihY/BrkB family envelope integrity protein [Arthrospira platensis SPKY1]
FYWDDCFSRASSLSYTTLFALVPAVYIMINMLSVFGVSEDQVNETVERLISGVLPPATGDVMLELKSQVIFWLERFRLNVQALKTFSILLIAFTTISLVNTMESALNAVWRVTSDKGIIMKISVFWTLISLG